MSRTVGALLATTLLSGSGAALAVWDLVLKGVAAPHFSSGNDLYGHFEAMPAQAIFYVRGVLDGLSVASAGGSALGYCKPAEATIGQLADVVAKRLRDKPEQRHLPAAYLVQTAMEEAFPCPRKQQ